MPLNVRKKVYNQNEDEANSLGTVFPTFGRRRDVSCDSSSSLFTFSRTSSHFIADPDQLKHTILLERLPLRHLKESAAKPQPRPSSVVGIEEEKGIKSKKKKKMAESFEELGLNEEVMGALKEMSIEAPTEIQCIGIPAVMDRKSVVLGSHTGSGKTLAYLLPIVQCHFMISLDMKIESQVEEKSREVKGKDELVAEEEKLLKEKEDKIVSLQTEVSSLQGSSDSAKQLGKVQARVVELEKQVRSRLLIYAIDMVVGTPGRILQHIEEGNMVYGDIAYLVLDEADTMFDRGFGPDIRKFLAPLKQRALKTNSHGFQTVLVTDTRISTWASS
ncbi:hypothetical protein Bca4012_075822 [Brassica carinata]